MIKNNIIIKPLITEKMSNISEKKGNRFGFIVYKKSTKPEIKKAIEELYDVKIISINTSVRIGKIKTRGTKKGFITGNTSSYKKAIVTLNEGQTIDFYSNV